MYSGTRHSIDYGDFAEQICNLLEENIIDKKFREWLMPNFTTTTDNDHVVASVLMMSTVQKYFGYECELMCGLPSVTLLGEKSDYESILEKVNDLNRFGEQTSTFASLLKPVISRFISSFDDRSAPSMLDFWERIFSSKSRDSSAKSYSGWITAFCFWDEQGEYLYRKLSAEFLDWTAYVIV